MAVKKKKKGKMIPRSELVDKISDLEREVTNKEGELATAFSNFQASQEENESLRNENDDLSRRLVMFEEDKAAEIKKIADDAAEKILDASKKNERAEEFYRAVIDLGKLEVEQFKITTERGSAEFSGLPFQSILTSLFGMNVKDPAQLFGVEAKLNYELWLTEIGPKKIQVIKIARNLTGYGLKEAKDLVDAAAASPSMVYAFTEFTEATNWLNIFRGTGAGVELR